MCLKRKTAVCIYASFESIICCVVGNSRYFLALQAVFGETGVLSAITAGKGYVDMR